MSSTSLDPSLWRELSGHLDRALDLEPAERDALNARGFLQNPPSAIADLTRCHRPSLAGKQVDVTAQPASSLAARSQTATLQS